METKTNEELLHLLSRRKVAELLDCSIATVKRREKSGILKPVMIGSHVKYRAADLQQVVAAATAQ